MTRPTQEAKRTWRPIAEIHEDLGPCVLINFRDAGYQEIGGNAYSDFDAKRWTHFAPLPKLTADEVEEWLEANPWLCNDCGKPIEWPNDECGECFDEKTREPERDTLANLGMCGADFR